MTTPLERIQAQRDAEAWKLILEGPGTLTLSPEEQAELRAILCALAALPATPAPEGQDERAEFLHAAIAGYQAQTEALYRIIDALRATPSVEGQTK